MVVKHHDARRFPRLRHLESSPSDGDTFETLHLLETSFPILYRTRLAFSLPASKHAHSAVHLELDMMRMNRYSTSTFLFGLNTPMM